MFSVCTARNNGIAYLLWRWLLRNNGKFVSWLDAFYFGASRGMNNYDLLAAKYKKTNVKPDKQYSILPTVLRLVGNCQGKIVVDVGCGGGFFTVPLAELGASIVYGIDNSSAQIELAKTVSPHPAVRYVQSDAFVDSMPAADIMVAPFVMNYARTLPVLHHFFKLIYHRLNEGGKLILVVDLPNGKNLKRFGAVKRLLGPPKDETPIHIDLYNGEMPICTLRGIYYTPTTIEQLLREVGFRAINWYTPIVSAEGIHAMGKSYWEGYTADPELGYLVAEK